ncbi:Fic family protein [uncultured Acetobacterium sp.]|uniref:Fic family protein n=1 Tax=uncultured Acetobacterium sp. TaxID=217139 RepID=UPI0025DD48F3|nr:Fic family protein [uncultured Acetobacterium sp.]
MNTRAGEYRINLKGTMEYKYFLPKPLPPNPAIEYDQEMVELLSKANRSVGILQGISSQVPDIDLFVSMYVRKEALLSSQIEGTQATLDDILDPNLDDNTNLEVEEVINYIRAASYAKQRVKALPISSRLLREIHEILLAGARGSEKNPGEFRRSQNWIGPQGGSLKDARFVPPNVNDMIDAMSDLEIFINQEDALDPLIKTGLVHYQFETIHPFLDGNGRIGRLMINLFLMERKVISYETLYISYFLKRNRIEYYDRLMEVRSKGNFEQWIKFFILAVYESAEVAIQTIEKLVKLNEQNTRLVENNVGRAKKTVKLVLKYLEGHPIIDIKKTSAALDLSYNTVSSAVKQLIDLGILVQTVSGQRNRVFAYEEYLQIMRKDTEY